MKTIPANPAAEAAERVADYIVSPDFDVVDDAVMSCNAPESMPLTKAATALQYAAEAVYKDAITDEDTDPVICDLDVLEAIKGNELGTAAFEAFLAEHNRVHRGQNRAFFYLGLAMGRRLGGAK